MIIAEFRLVSEEFLFGQQICLEAFDSMGQLMQFLSEMREEDFAVIPTGIFFSSECPDIESSDYEFHITTLLNRHYDRLFKRIGGV